MKVGPGLVSNENEVALWWAERRMVRWLCDVKVKDRFPSKEMRERPGIDDTKILSSIENRGETDCILTLTLTGDFQFQSAVSHVGDPHTCKISRRKVSQFERCSDFSS